MYESICKANPFRKGCLKNKKFKLLIQDPQIGDTYWSEAEIEAKNSEEAKKIFVGSVVRTADEFGELYPTDKEINNAIIEVKEI